MKKIKYQLIFLILILCNTTLSYGSILDIPLEILENQKISILVQQETNFTFDSLTINPFGYILKISSNNPMYPIKYRCLFISVNEGTPGVNIVPSDKITFSQFEDCSGQKDY